MYFSMSKFRVTARSLIVSSLCWGMIGPTVTQFAPRAAAEERTRNQHQRGLPFDTASEISPIVFPGTNPTLRWDQHGHLNCVFVDHFDSAPRVVYRRIDGETSTVQPVSPPEFKIREHGEMPPTIEVLSDGTLVVTYVVALPGFRKSALFVQRSQDQGKSWQAPVLLHDDGNEGGHAFFSTGKSSDGRVLFTWLDGRSGQQGLITAASSDGCTITPNQSIDPKTCQCCGTALLAGRDGEVWIAYRDLTSDGSGQQIRDISVIASRDGGETFDLPMAISNDRWAIDGCPHTGPRLARAKDGALWATWYTGAPSGIYVARSVDAGRSFSRRERISEGRHPEIGVLPNGSVVVLYEGRNDGEQAIMVRQRSTEQPGWNPPILLAEQGHHPKMAVDHENVAIAYESTGPNAAATISVLRWRSAE